MTLDGNRKGIHRVCMTWDEASIELCCECNCGGNGAHKGGRVECCRLVERGRLSYDRTCREEGASMLSEKDGCVEVGKRARRFQVRPQGVW